jgi:hypothetical protein
MEQKKLTCLCCEREFTAYFPLCSDCHKAMILMETGGDMQGNRIRGLPEYPSTMQKLKYILKMYKLNK